MFESNNPPPARSSTGQNLDAESGNGASQPVLGKSLWLALLQDVLRNLRNYANPLYHVRRMIEDLTLFKRAMLDRKAFEMTGCREHLAEIFRGKLFGVFFLSGPFGMVGFFLGTAGQIQSQNPWVGLLTTLLVGPLAPSIAYQVFWWLDNKKMYRELPVNPWRRFLAFERDLLPVHAFGLQLALAFIFVLLPLNGAIILAVEALNPQVARVLPTPILVVILDILLLQTTFVRLMGDFFERYSRRLAARYGSPISEPVANG